MGARTDRVPGNPRPRWGPQGSLRRGPADGGVGLGSDRGPESGRAPGPADPGPRSKVRRMPAWALGQIKSAARRRPSRRWSGTSRSRSSRPPSGRSARSSRRRGSSRPRRAQGQGPRRPVMASWALGQIEAPTASIPDGRPKDSDEEVRIAVAWALGQIDARRPFRRSRAAQKDNRTRSAAPPDGPSPRSTATGASGSGPRFESGTDLHARARGSGSPPGQGGLRPFPGFQLQDPAGRKRPASVRLLSRAGAESSGPAPSVPD